jgi:hypothetical protein
MTITMWRAAKLHEAACVMVGRGQYAEFISDTRHVYYVDDHPIIRIAKLRRGPWAVRIGNGQYVFELIDGASSLEEVKAAAVAMWRLRKKEE